MLRERISILFDNNVINLATKNYMDKIITKLDDYNISGDASMFVTHLAMATNRMFKGEKINVLEAAMLEAIEAENVYLEAVKLFEQFSEDAPVVYTHEELGYIYLHLCNLLNTPQAAKS